MAALKGGLKPAPQTSAGKNGGSAPAWEAISVPAPGLRLI
jgi:hypothetical protein